MQDKRQAPEKDDGNERTARAGSDGKEKEREGKAVWLIFQRKFINCLLKHCEIWKQGQFQQ